MLGAVLVLFLFLLYAGYFLLRDKVMPPIGENLLAVASAALTLKMADRGFLPQLWIPVGASLVFALGYLLVRREETKDVESRLTKLIKDCEPARTIGDWLIKVGSVHIEADYMPDSLANKVSGMPRRERRNDFLGLMKAIYPGHAVGNGDLCFFPVDYKERTSRKVTKWLTFASFLLFLYAAVYDWIIDSVSISSP